jgi:hypothetical protein
MPQVNTNQILLLIVAATVLAGIAAAAATDWRRPWDLVALPAVRLELLAVYFWSGWDKLNRDFFDPRFSSAAYLWERFWRGGRTGEAAVIWATVLIELGAPLLLLCRRSRGAAVWILLGFHLILGTVLFYGFSTTMIALLALFAPSAWLERLTVGPGGRRALAGAAVAVVAGGVAMNLVLHQPTHAAFRALWLAGAASGLGWVLWRRPWRQMDGEEPAPEPMLAAKAAVWVFPAAIFFNGICPYIGLKTEGSFAMYSNLRTENGRSNHFVVSRPWHGFGYLDDLVVVEASSDPGLERWAKRGLELPWIELRLEVDALRKSAGGPVALTYVRQGRRTVLADALTAAPFAMRPAWWQRKFLSFREILPDGSNGFSH